MEKFKQFYEFLEANPLDFTTWSQFLGLVESSNDLYHIRKAFGIFLSHFPLTFGYWKKYADLDAENREDIYEKAIEMAGNCLEIWQYYLDFAMEIKSSKFVRSLFRRAIRRLGVSYLSGDLWKKWIKWEESRDRMDNVTKIYLTLLSTPVREIDEFWDHFKKHVQNRDTKELISPKQLFEIDEEIRSDPRFSEVKRGMSEIDMFRLKKIMERHDKLYKSTSTRVNRVSFYESEIKRTFFHIKPLNYHQLNNWNQYINFAEDQYENGSEKIEYVKMIYERALIPCALYVEIWKRYTIFFESHNMIDEAREVYEKATKIFVKNRPDIFISYAEFEERNKKYSKARELYQYLINKMAIGHIETIVKYANFEKRMFKISQSRMDEKKSQDEQIIEIYKNGMDIFEKKLPDSKIKDKRQYAYLSMEYCKVLYQIYQKKQRILKNYLNNYDNENGNVKDLKSKNENKMNIENEKENNIEIEIEIEKEKEKGNENENENGKKIENEKEKENEKSNEKENKKKIEIEIEKENDTNKEIDDEKNISKIKIENKEEEEKMKNEANKYLILSRKVIEKALETIDNYKPLWLFLIDYEMKIGGKDIYPRIKKVFERCIGDGSTLSKDEKISMLSLFIKISKFYSDEIILIRKAEEKLLKIPTVYSNHKDLENKKRLIEQIIELGNLKQTNKF
ncbi:pre-mRNA-processing factor [Anaeramoeba flamelloides]|uniref:Pre-mRNA-processing factor n=1 Tax=Anaeramoeba flamelloides TaxID=1746091 RepID=A0AAV7Y887_9EUKA|nr:pre-mRNA-processing factor [Anaeramoeba flamelloides]